MLLVTDRDIDNDFDIVGDGVDEQDMKNGLHDRVTLAEGALLRETLMLRDGDCGRPVCVLLLVVLRDNDCDCVSLRDLVTDTDVLAITLSVGGTDNDGLILNPNDFDWEGVAIFEANTDADTERLFDTVIDVDIDWVAENEHDLNNGLHDRVTLTEAALLRDTVVLGDCDFVNPN